MQPVVVEPGLADRDDTRMAREAHELVDRGLGGRIVVRMRADRRVDVWRVLGDLEHRRKGREVDGDRERVRDAIMEERKLYPMEYATPVPILNHGVENSIVGSHSLFPEVLFHAFSTFGALMSPDLPLRRDQHEMIATMVSVTNRCVY